MAIWPNELAMGQRMDSGNEHHHPRNSDSDAVEHVAASCKDAMKTTSGHERLIEDENRGPRLMIEELRSLPKCKTTNVTREGAAKADHEKE